MHSDTRPETETEKPSRIAAFRRRLRGLFSSRQESTIREAIEEAIEEVLEEHEGEAQSEQLAPEEKNILRNALTFGDIAVSDIMTPRTDILAVPHDITLETLKAHINEQRHTRIPVFRGGLDHVEGFLHLKDLLPMIAGDQPFNLRRVMRPMLFVPPSMRVPDLLLKMRRQGSHMAIVVDEYGGTDGLVTLEDVFEEIVGDIQDEHDDEENRELVRLSPDSWDADARIRMDRLESEIGIDFTSEHEEEEFDTLGGLIFFLLGRVPARGEVIRHGEGVTLEIIDADPRRIKRVRISLAPQ